MKLIDVLEGIWYQLKRVRTRISFQNGQEYENFSDDYIRQIAVWKYRVLNRDENLQPIPVPTN